jgi:hypothetical protein
MNSERAQAYGRVMKAIEALGSAKLHADEQQTIRDAADALFFCEDLGADAAATDALSELNLLVERLLESERITPETARALTADVESCGPLAPVG